MLFTLASLAGIAVSITGNETAQRWGRARVVTVAMSTAAVLSLLTGWSASAPAVLGAALVVLWNAAIYFDSSALTAGTVQAADKEFARGYTKPTSLERSATIRNGRSAVGHFGAQLLQCQQHGATDGYGNAKVHKYAPDGKLLLLWGEPGSNPGQFNLIHNLHGCRWLGLCGRP